VALRELLVEGFRGIRSARLRLDRTTVLIGENDCGKSSLLEALALVLSPLGDRVPKVQPWQFHREGRDASATAGPVRIQVTLGETAAGSWDRADLGVLAPVLGRKSTDPRALVVELCADPSAGAEPAVVHWEIRNPAGRGRRSRDDAEALEAVRRLNPLVWLRGGALVRTATPGASGDAGGAWDTIPDAALVLRSYERLVSGETPSHEGEIDSGYAAAERLLAEWAPAARGRRLSTRAAVADVLGHVLEHTIPGRPPGAPLPGTTAQKLGVLLLTAGVLQQLHAGAAPGVRPVIVIEEPEAGLHPMTLASVWGLLEGLSAQKVVTTNSGTLLSAVPIRSLRRLVRDRSGVVREWRVREGALRKDDLRKVSYHLRARRGAACFARCWLLVEGETEYWILPDLARLLGHDLVQEGIACVEFAQCGLGPLVKLARALGIEWHVLADGDRAGETYSGLARSFLRGEEASMRISTLDDRDIEHCFWRHGHAPVFERLAGPAAQASGASPRRVIEKAIDRHSKPGVAFELLASVAATGSVGVPPPLQRTIEACVALARGTAPGGRPSMERTAS
jgi:putative ATP-dependent endonuclease of the OLD family